MEWLLESLIKIQLKWKRTVEYYVMRKAEREKNNWTFHNG